MFYESDAVRIQTDSLGKTDADFFTHPSDAVTVSIGVICNNYKPSKVQKEVGIMRAGTCIIKTICYRKQVRWYESIL